MAGRDAYLDGLLASKISEGSVTPALGGKAFQVNFGYLIRLPNNLRTKREQFCPMIVKPCLARRKGFEPLTPRFEVWCSIQLSYRRVSLFL